MELLLNHKEYFSAFGQGFNFKLESFKVAVLFLAGLYHQHYKERKILSQAQRTNVFQAKPNKTKAKVSHQRR